LSPFSSTIARNNLRLSDSHASSSLSYYSQISDSPYSSQRPSLSGRHSQVFSQNNNRSPSALGVLERQTPKRQSTRQQQSQQKPRRFSQISIAADQEKTFITEDGHMDYDAISHDLEPSYVPSPEKLDEGRDLMMDDNDRWERTRSRFEASRKAHEIYSQMAGALQDLTDHAAQKDIETADALDLLGEFVATDQAVEFTKMMEKSKGKVEEILQAHENISQTRHNLLRDVKKWFDETTDEVGETDGLGMDLMSEDSFQEPRKNLDQLLTQMKRSSGKLQGIQVHINEMRKIMELVKSNAVVPVSVLKSSMQQMEHTLDAMNSDLEEATLRYQEAETKCKTLEEALKDQKQNKKKNNKKQAERYKNLYSVSRAQSERKEKQLESKLQRLQKDTDTAVGAVKTEQADKKNYAVYAQNLKNDIVKRDKLLEESSEKVLQMSKMVADMEDEMARVKKENDELIVQKESDKNTLDQKIQEVKALKKDAAHKG
jgi:DNA repair exonuclease SbcCD ATPase subunit